MLHGTYNVKSRKLPVVMSKTGSRKKKRCAYTRYYGKRGSRRTDLLSHMMVRFDIPNNLRPWETASSAHWIGARSLSGRFEQHVTLLCMRQNDTWFISCPAHCSVNILTTLSQHLGNTGYLSGPVYFPPPPNQKKNIKLNPSALSFLLAACLRRKYLEFITLNKNI